MDPVSAILTIVATSRTVVKETYKYIQEVNVVNDLIENLLDKLKALHKLIGVVQSTLRRADTSGDNPSAIFVAQILTSCQKRLALIKSLVLKLAAQESETWLQKVALKRKSDMAKKEIEMTIHNIHCDMEYIRTGISCWSLDVASANRRISEVIAVQQPISIRTDLQQILHHEISPLSRTLSEADTVFGFDPIVPVQRSSTATSPSRPSISSTSSQSRQAQSTGNDGIRSSPSLSTAKSNSDWVDFHFRVAKCEGNKERNEEIRILLQQHAEARTLATSTDGVQRTPLHLAAQRGDVELARTLVNFGADINASDSEPSTVLDLAVANNHRRFVSFLLDQGVDETTILERNKTKFKEMKRIIDFSRGATKSRPKKEGRKLSWSTRRSLSS